MSQLLSCVPQNLWIEIQLTLDLYPFIHLLGNWLNSPCFKHNEFRVSINYLRN
ncbi:hypothetical protein EMIT07CA2_140105 [Brevibacillus sp. IT-7CA2]